jgi:hypothetical protein
MISIRHVTLPEGLSAFAQRGPDEELNVYVSDTLSADRQRAAVRAALRATRRQGWRTALPAPSVGLLLALGVGWLRRSARVLQAHTVAWVTAVAVAAAAGAALYLALVPHPHGPGPVSAGQPAAPGVSQSPVPSQPAPHPSRTHHVHPHRPTSTPTAVPQVAPMSTMPVRPVPTSSPPPPVPAPSGVPAPVPTPSPTPSPPPTPHKGGHCVGLLGIRVCLGVSLQQGLLTPGPVRLSAGPARQSLPHPAASSGPVR